MKKLDLSGPIADAVMPLKTDAVMRAEKEERNYIARLLEGLEAAGWDANAYAPHPSTNQSRADYLKKLGLYKMVRAITTRKKDSPLSLRGPEISVVNYGGVERVVQMAKDDAAAQYDAFVAKMIKKIGEVDAATLTGCHVWGYSTLTAQKTDGTIERWRTQMIVNRSVYNKLFNQYPSRKIK